MFYCYPNIRSGLLPRGMTWSMSLNRAQRIALYRVGLTLHWLKHPGEKAPHLTSATSNTIELTLVIKA